MRNSKLLSSCGFSERRGWVYLNHKHEVDFTQKEDLAFVKSVKPELIIFEDSQWDESRYLYEQQIKDLTCEKIFASC